MCGASIIHPVSSGSHIHDPSILSFWKIRTRTRTGTWTGTWTRTRTRTRTRTWTWTWTRTRTRTWTWISTRTGTRTQIHEDREEESFFQHLVSYNQSAIHNHAKDFENTIGRYPVHEHNHATSTAFSMTVELLVFLRNPQRMTKPRRAKRAGRMNINRPFAGFVKFPIVLNHQSRSSRFQADSRSFARRSRRSRRGPPLQ